MQKLADLAGCDMQNVDMMNIKDAFTLYLQDGPTKKVPLTDLGFARMDASRYCMIFSPSTLIFPLVGWVQKKINAEKNAA